MDDLIVHVDWELGSVVQDGEGVVLVLERHEGFTDEVAQHKVVSLMGTLSVIFAEVEIG